MSISPLAQGSLDKALGLAIGLRGIGAGEAMFEAEGGHGIAHSARAITGAVIGVNALGLNAMVLEESEGGVEEGQSAVSGFIGEELGEGETAVVVEGDVEIFPASAADMIALAVASDAMTGAFEAGELLNVEVDEFAWVGAFIALDRRRRGELGQAKAMTAQEGLLRGLFGSVFAPSPVMQEFERLAAVDPRFAGLTFPTFIEIKSVTQLAPSLLLNHRLQQGEREPLALAVELGADAVLRDERAGRLRADDLGLKSLGVPGILVQAKTNGLRPAIKPLLDRLQSRLRFWIAPTLGQQILRSVAE